MLTTCSGAMEWANPPCALSDAQSRQDRHAGVAEVQHRPRGWLLLIAV